MVENTSDIKEKILFFIKANGPSLPVHIAKAIGSNTLFTSAFLSEMLSERKIKISNLKIGNSPLYYLPGQEYALERFSHYLKSKEKDAFLLLKEKRFLADSAQSPAIRVALRMIKDFAIPFQKTENGEIFWRYFTIPESEFKTLEAGIKEAISTPQIPEIPPKNTDEQESKIIKTGLILESGKKMESEITKSKAPPQKKIKSAKKPKGIKKSVGKRDNPFFNKVKSWASVNSIEIINIEGFSKSELHLRARDNAKGGEFLVSAFNKKRISDSDLISANRKAKELGLKYVILSVGEPQKRVNDFIDAARNLFDIKKIG